MKELLTTNPSKRLTASQALRHTWFTASLHSNEDLRMARRNMKRHLRLRFKVCVSASECVCLSIALELCLASQPGFWAALEHGAATSVEHAEVVCMSWKTQIKYPNKRTQYQLVLCGWQSEYEGDNNVFANSWSKECGFLCSSANPSATHAQAGKMHRLVQADESVCTQ